MYSAISIFSMATESVRGNLSTRLKECVQSLEGRFCGEQNWSENVELPWLASLEKHQFSWIGSRNGSLDLVQRDGKLLQCDIRLQYPKRRWFSPLEKDWNQLVGEAGSRLGPGHCLDMGDKTLMNFQQNNLKVLLARYQEKKHAFIEIKVAADQFCY